MKIMKKIAAAVLASAALFAFVGCSEDDDPNEMIEGGGSNYSIDYTNETGDTSRGYNSTALKHAGAAVRLDFKDVSTKSRAGIMGVIFDLEESSGKKSFDIVGVMATGENKLACYVSRFENITDILAKNFGATTSAADGQPKEIQYVGGDTSSTWKSAEGVITDGTVSVWPFVRLIAADAYGTDSKNNSYERGDYIYEVYLLKNNIKNVSGDGIPVDADGNNIKLTDDVRVATIKTSYTKQDQHLLAVYANVYAGKTLTGNWTFCGTYKEVGVDED